jgi:phosphatidylserine/phosphatidylglycerophosphate/cardiolipin synthase-like enzyme
MANTGVQGRVVFAGTTKGIPALEIVVVDFDPFSSEDILRPAKQPGQTEQPITTDENGKFAISYSADRYRAWISDRNPDIVVRVYGPGGRLLHETREHSDVKDAVLDVGEIQIHKDNIEGWLVTNATLHPEEGIPVALTKGNEVTWLIDGSAMFPELTDAVEGAKHSINLMNLNFWTSKNLITKFQPGFNPVTVKDGDTVQGQGIQEIMKRKATEQSPVRVVVHDIPLSRRDSVDEVEDYFKGSPVSLRVFRSFLSLAHAKAVVVDGKTAFVTGSTMGRSYFNDQLHRIHDARHGGSLFHDVNAKVSGPAVEHIDGMFATIWNSLGPLPTLLPDTGQAQVESGVTLQVVRTLPGGRFVDSRTGKGIPHGETGALEAYQRGITNATDLVYIEDQYFTSPEIVTALLRRMRQIPNLEVIIVLNAKPDVEGYPELQTSLIGEFRRALAQIEKALKQSKNRLGVFTLWSCDETQSPFQIAPIYAHSKAATVDDRWATVGSANLDGASMNQLQTGTVLDGQFSASVEPYLMGILTTASLLVAFLTVILGVAVFYWFLGIVGVGGLSAQIIKSLILNVRPTQHANPQRSNQPPRSTELNVVIFNNIAGLSAIEQNHVAQLREELWREHLGYLPNTPEASNFPTTRPADGWVAFWTARAGKKLEAINNRKRHEAKILEWKPETDPEKYLQALGVQTGNLKVRKEADKFDFEKRKWEYLD